MIAIDTHPDAPKLPRRLTFELDGPPLSYPLFEVTPQTLIQLASTLSKT